MSLLALLPSPLLGPAIWEPVAEVLRGLGRPARAVDLSGTAPPSNAREALRAFIRALPQDEDLVLVPHSNAGVFVPAIAAERRVSAVIFADAGLPPVNRDRAPIATPEICDVLSKMADDEGLLPPWTGWWTEEEAASLFPDIMTRVAVERQQRRLPVSYFHDSVPVPQGWDRRPCTYLAFGQTYQTEIDTARRLRWPVRILDGKHLEMLVRPQDVAEGIIDLLRCAV